jgi:hypothetical protein
MNPLILNPLKSLHTLRRRVTPVLLSLSVLAMSAAPLTAQARDGVSEASVASALSLGVPLAVSATAPAVVMSAGAVLAVVSVQVVAGSTIWVLERASDAARITLKMSAAGVEAASIGVGTSVMVTAVSAGWILSAAGKALCFVPNEIGASLTHHERITR